MRIDRRVNARGRGLNSATAESTSEETRIGRISAGCSKIHELSDRVRLSGVCSVKLALAHRIAPDRATTAAQPPPPQRQETKVCFDRSHVQIVFPDLRLAGCDDKSALSSLSRRARRDGGREEVQRRAEERVRATNYSRPMERLVYPLRLLCAKPW